MLSKHPDPDRDEPATSPALARRRDHMLRSDAVRHIEPRLVPSADEEQPSFLPEPAFDLAEDEPDPDIPPPPPPTLRAGSDSALERTGQQPPHRPRLWPLGAAAVAIVVGGGVAWLVYDRTPAAPASGEGPYVAAEADAGKDPAAAGGRHRSPEPGHPCLQRTDRLQTGNGERSTAAAAGSADDAAGRDERRTVERDGGHRHSERAGTGTRRRARRRDGHPARRNIGRGICRRGHGHRDCGRTGSDGDDDWCVPHSACRGQDLGCRAGRLEEDDEDPS